MRRIYTNYTKRIFDFLCGTIFFILSAPLCLLIAVCLLFAAKESPFFVQKRPGRKEKIFRVIKFKTMNNKRDKEGRLLPDVERLTWIGKIIRKTSLDELPQLWNIIIGDMSFIGPRPLLVEYLSYYPANYRKRHDVRPGITGLAQVAGRNNIPFSKRFDLDIQYVDNVSFSLDLKIVFKTIAKVIMQESVRLDQTVDEIDDIGLTKALGAEHFKK